MEHKANKLKKSNMEKAAAGAKPGKKTGG